MEKYDEQSEEDSLSYIDLGKCEKLLKINYTIPEDESLIIYIVDIKSENSLTTNVQYKIFHPITLEPLDYLSVCSEEKVSISISGNDKTKLLCDGSSNSGYNLFDANDSFYNDICATYTTENGTDITLSDRRNVIKESGGSLDLCQEGCEKESFNCTTQKAKCNCNIKETKVINNLKDIEISKILVLNLIEGLKYSNYLVMKCYHLLLNFDFLKKNLGFIIMALIFIIILIIFIIYIIKGRKKIDYYIQAVLKNKAVYIENRKNLKKNIKQTSNVKINDSKKIIKRKKNGIKIKRNEKDYNKKNNIMIGPPVKRKNKSLDNQNNISQSYTNLNKNSIKNVNINIIPIKNIHYGENRKKRKDLKKEIKNSKKRKKNIVNSLNKKNKPKIYDSEKKLNKNATKNKGILDIDYRNYQLLNIEELNILDYDIAILVDKRTYFQFYIGLIRKKHLLIFTFLPIDDYNLVSLKIASFFLQFSLYMAVNALFFTDNTMHQIYLNEGKMNLGYHLPRLLYTSLISIVINVILRNLSKKKKNILSRK